MKRIILSALIVGLFVFTPYPANSCTCSDLRSPRKELRKAKAVFIGEVIGVDEKTMATSGELNFLYKITFKVKLYWKGIKESEVTVMSDQGLLPCSGFAFREAKEYLVYAHGKDLIVITGCSRNKLVENASEDLKELGTGMTPKDSVSVESHLISQSLPCAALTDASR
jgi:hypothetical protein